MSTPRVERPHWWNDTFTEVCKKTLEFRYSPRGSFNMDVLDKLKMHLVKMSTRGIGYDEKTIEKFWGRGEVPDLTVDERRMLRDFDYQWVHKVLVVNDELRAAFERPLDLEHYASGQGGSPVMCGYCLAKQRPYKVAWNKDIRQPRCATCGTDSTYVFTRGLSESDLDKYKKELGEVFADAASELSKKEKEDWQKKATNLKEKTGLRSATKNHLLTEEEMERYYADPRNKVDLLFPGPKPDDRNTSAAPKAHQVAADDVL